jgi:methyl-accepting chemotaxis protein
MTRTVEGREVAAAHRRRRFLARRSVRTKILVVLGIACLGMVAVAVSARIVLGTMGDAATALYQQGVNAGFHESLVHQQEIKVRMDLLGHAHEQTAAGKAEWAQAIADDEAELDASVAAYNRLAGNTTDLAPFTESWDRVRQLYTDLLLPASLRGDVDAWWTAFNDQVKPEIKNAVAALDDLEARRTADGAQHLAVAQDAKNSGETFMLIVLAVALLGGTSLAVAVANRIVRPLHQVAAALGTIAAGDLTTRVVVDTEDEVGQMAAALNQAAASMDQAIADIEQSAAELGDASHALTTTSDTMATGAQTMVSNSEQLSAVVDEIATNAGTAAAVAERAVAAAQSTTTTIGKLGSSSSEIGTVVNTITTIAEQTNLLALNATIEAARAGDAGKGFAVVAGEVKDLAAKTADATDDISGKIETIQVDTSHAVTAIAEISTIIQQISQVHLGIASAIRQNDPAHQTADCPADVTAYIHGVVGVAESVSTGASDTRRAAGNLFELSHHLNGLVSSFRTSSVPSAS